MAILVPTYDLAQRIGRSIEIDAGTVEELIERALERFGEDLRPVLRTALIAVNGVAISRLDLGKTRLGPEDEVWLLVPAAGG